MQVEGFGLTFGVWGLVFLRFGLGVSFEFESGGVVWGFCCVFDLTLGGLGSVSGLII